jgi:hypothetical protein
LEKLEYEEGREGVVCRLDSEDDVYGERKEVARSNEEHRDK